jgi:hypothetical protein
MKEKSFITLTPGDPSKENKSITKLSWDKLGQIETNTFYH